jgi:hypothetical protein
LGKIYFFYPSNILARCLALAWNNTPALHNLDYDFFSDDIIKYRFPFFHQISKKLRMNTNSIIELNRTAYQKTSLSKTTFGKRSKFHLVVKGVHRHGIKKKLSAWLIERNHHFSVFELEAKP